MDRYQRHVQMEDFGQGAQDKLSRSSVVVVGAGGLGCPVLMQLVAMGVGKIGIVDGDVVEISNLHRQLLYTEGDVGRPKVEVALLRLQKMNSTIEIKTFYEFVDHQNIFSIFEHFDIIVDGTDQIFTRYLINDACLVLNKPLVYGSVFRFEGQVAVFNVKVDKGRSSNYRNLYPDPKKNQGAISCNEAGVLGLLPNIVGAFMANEVVKLITGSGQPLVDKILYYNLKNNDQRIFEIENIPGRNHEMTREKVENTDYMVLCNQQSSEEAQFVVDLLKTNTDVVLVDVRELGEEPEITGFPYVRIPLKELEKYTLRLKNQGTVVFICQSGTRSKKAMEWANNNLSGVSVYHYEPGVKALLYNLTHV